MMFKKSAPKGAGTGLGQVRQRTQTRMGQASPKVGAPAPAGAGKPMGAGKPTGTGAPRRMQAPAKKRIG